jgi:DNA-binding XRE family transcriptional regulator
MGKPRYRTFRQRLREDLKDPEFRREYEKNRRMLALSMKILALRKKKGLTQAQLAKRMGTSQQAVSRIESGDYEGFTLKTLEKFAQATGTRLKIDFISAA